MPKSLRGFLCRGDLHHDWFTTATAPATVWTDCGRYERVLKGQPIRRTCRRCSKEEAFVPPGADWPGDWHGGFWELAKRPFEI